MGQKLVILDDLVLNFSNYEHPGGDYLLEHNIGRDISKFFYGGYSLSSIQRPFSHPPDTYPYINSMRIGRLSLNTELTPFF